MPTVNLQVEAGIDDLSWHNEGVGSFSTTASTILIGDSDSANFNRWGLVRFDNVTIVKDASITTAPLTMKPTGIAGTIPALRFYGVNAKDPIAPTTRSAANALALTSAYVDYTPPTWVVGTPPTPAPDLAPIVQELVNRSDWASGDAIEIVITVPRPDAFVSANAISFRSYDTTPADAAKLAITYSGAFVGTADAGPDQTDLEAFSTAHLDGTASTGSPTVYQWEALTDGAPELSDPSVAQPTFVVPGLLPGEPNSWTYGLKVGNASSLTPQDTVTVTALPHNLFVRKGTGWAAVPEKARKSAAWV